MFRKTGLLLISLLILLTLACGFSASVGNESTLTPAPGSSGVIEKITLAQGVQGDDAHPVNPTTVFSKQATIHAVVRVKNAPDDTKVTASWFVVDVGGAAEAGSSIDSADYTTGGTRNIDFTLKPKNPWPAGKYKVEILVNGESYKTLEYTVK